MALVAGCGGGDPTATDAEKVFADGFLSDRAEVELIAEGGTIIGGYDAWLVLRPSARLVPRYDDRYGSIPCDQPLGYFNKLPTGAALETSAVNALECRAYTDPRLAIPNGRWLIIDHRDGRVYFRVWKGR